MTVFVVIADDAHQLEPHPPLVFAQPHQAEQQARNQVGASATRVQLAQDHVQYVSASGDLFLNIYEVEVQGCHKAEDRSRRGTPA